jgi:hypothetical protein
MISSHNTGTHGGHLAFREGKAIPADWGAEKASNLRPKFTLALESRLSH